MVVEALLYLILLSILCFYYFSACCVLIQQHNCKSICQIFLIGAYTILGRIGFLLCCLFKTLLFSFCRFNRVGARVKSEADMEEIMDNLQEQAMEDKKMRSYAVIPPLLLDAKERKITYQNNNGHIEDMEAVYKSREHLNIWTPSEKEIFKEKYLQHPKNFGAIASYLERKSVADCVQYYYLSKKTENYKQLLRKSRLRQRSSRNNPQKVNSSSNATIVAVLLTSGVTTRLQREQQQKTVGQNRELQDTPQASTSTTCTTSTTTPSSECPSSSAATSTVCNSTSVTSSPTPVNSSSSVISGTTTMLTSSTTITAVTATTQSEAKSPATAENPPSEEKVLSDVSGKFFGEEGKSDNAGSYEASAGESQAQKDGEVNQEAVR